MRHLIREGSKQKLYRQVSWLVTVVYFPSRPAVAEQWNPVNTTFMLLTVARQPGFAPGSF